MRQLAVACLVAAVFASAPDARAGGTGGDGVGGGVGGLGVGGLGVGGSAGTGPGGAGGAGGAAACDHDGVCDKLAGEDCGCDDCDVTALCIPDQCKTDGVCTFDDACICPDCDKPETEGAAYCGDPCSCNNDGTCDSFNEGCACGDCNPSKEECNDNDPPGVCDPPTGAGGAAASSGAVSTGSFGATGSAAPAGDDGGCGCRLVRDDDERSAIALFLACAAIASSVGRRRRRT